MLPEEIQKLEYIYEHFQDCKKLHELDPEVLVQDSDNTIYPYVNNDIEYSLFENVIDSNYLDSQIKNGFTCDKTCYLPSDNNNTFEQHYNAHMHMIIYHNNSIN